MAEIELDTVGEGERTVETTETIGEEHVPTSSVRVVARSEAVVGEGRNDKPPPYLGPPGAEEEGGSPARTQGPSFTLPKMEVNRSVIKWALIIVGVLAAVVVLLVVVLVPISFADINYYEVSWFSVTCTHPCTCTRTWHSLMSAVFDECRNHTLRRHGLIRWAVRPGSVGASP